MGCVFGGYRVCLNPPRQRSATCPWNSSIWCILGHLVRSAVHFDRILTLIGLLGDEFPDATGGEGKGLWVVCSVASVCALRGTPPPHTVGLLAYFGARFDRFGNVLGPRKGLQAEEQTRIGSQVASGLPESPLRHQRDQHSKISRPTVCALRGMQFCPQSGKGCVLGASGRYGLCIEGGFRVYARELRGCMLRGLTPSAGSVPKFVAQKPDSV
jgi:hypothetical protein